MPCHCRLLPPRATAGVASPPASSPRAAKLERLADGRAISFFYYDWLLEKLDTSSLGSPTLV